MVLTGINSMNGQVSLSYVFRATAEYITVLINGHCKLLTFSGSDILRYPLHEGLQVLWEIFGVITSISAGCLCSRTIARNICGMNIR